MVYKILNLKAVTVSVQLVTLSNVEIDWSDEKKIDDENILH
jgi:hypothetical protein